MWTIEQRVGRLVEIQVASPILMPELQGFGQRIGEIAARLAKLSPREREILRGIATRFETYHNVQIGDPAVVAAVMLTLRRRTGVKQQDPAAQSRVRAQDRIRMVSMPAEGRAPAGDAHQRRRVAGVATGMKRK